MRVMKKVAIAALLISIVFGCGSPAYARHHLNKEARAAQKRNKALAKQQKKQAKALRKARRQARHP
jgi:hypothetical protein